MMDIYHMGFWYFSYMKKKINPFLGINFTLLCNQKE